MNIIWTISIFKSSSAPVSNILIMHQFIKEKEDLKDIKITILPLTYDTSELFSNYFGWD